ncbi:NO-inducible flavohemoprotein [Zavarzinia compransoris]|uniref:nitric oxide dioxygenase n=1 Tax=Zavarzinia compransoris TaxID=1264899 RepID=A0A317E687_9PROT|nr:NO-inducible flavohemoprotein [Zavarzinia compransoris]PWR22132.1 NO-inducible flavohemoprotein [Zavarzinia compransoris]TDP47119.1 nitric oxide dioxygenase [Zavarzinia compransoris]
MSKPLSDRTIALVKATIPALEAHGLAIVREMYDRLFQDAGIRALFNQSHHGGAGAQPKALAGAILAYAAHIDDLAALAPAVERIAQKHAGLQILPEHYPHVATALLGAIKAVLGDAATDDILAAWGEAYWFLADILIARESRIYGEIAAAAGGWAGWRDFVIEKVTPESAVIASFTLRPADGGPVLRHRPGQYLTFWLDLPGHGPVKRNYSLSAAADGATYRISVKREPGGLASNWLHDAGHPGTVLKVAAPAGEFFLAEAPQRPVVLLSGGVGLTPLVAMWQEAARRHPGLPVQFVHGTLDGSTHALAAEIRALADETRRITTFYQSPRAADVAARDYDRAGLIDGAWLQAHTPVAAADYYLCGPRGFLRALVAALSLAGVPADRIHYEFFGPADELLAA